MRANGMSETKLREQQELAASSAEATKDCHSSAHTIVKIIGLAALALGAAAVITSLHDIRRYIRISTM